MTDPSRKFTLKSFLMSFLYAFNGLKQTLEEERNMRIHLIAAIAVVVLGLLFHISRTDWIIVTLCIGLVMSMEIMNTALEKLTDLVSPQKNKLAGHIKDIAAGAVLIAAVTALIAGLFVFLPHVINLIKQI